MKIQAKTVWIPALALMLIAAITTLALAGTNELTKQTIATRTLDTQNAARKEVIAADTFAEKTMTVGETTVTYHEAQKDGAPVGYVFVVETKGKSSGLFVMTGIDVGGHITGVKVTENNETAGYVDKVTNGGLFKALTGKAAQESELNTVDAVSTATKTSNGIKSGVKTAAAYYRQIIGGAQGE